MGLRPVNPSIDAGLSARSAARASGGVSPACPVCVA